MGVEMKVNELMARFPEIPSDLADEPLLGRFAEALDPLLRGASKPSACATHHDVPHHYYLKLIGPLAIYGYGLRTREQLLQQLAELLRAHDADAESFARGLLPEDAARD